jgi:hypothetical protein
MLDYFDCITKPAFRESNHDRLAIKFGGARDTDPKRQIDAGKLYLEGYHPFICEYDSAAEIWMM